MPAAAPAKSSSGSSSKSSSSSRKSTARSATKTTSEPRSTFGKAVDELRDKRASFDQPIVDTPVAVIGLAEATDIAGKKKITFTPQGASIEISIGSEKVTLDGEGVKQVQNAVDRVSVGM